VIKRKRAEFLEGKGMSENVNHPAHYRQGSMEVIDAIEGLELGFHAGNVVKYVARYKAKGGLEDLKKAAWYLRRLIDIEEAKDRKGPLT
jgi:hypothetical protein